MRHALCAMLFALCAHVKNKDLTPTLLWGLTPFIENRVALNQRNAKDYGHWMENF
jgi:hypothetical protein